MLIKEGLLRLRLSVPWVGCHQTKSATGVAFFIVSSLPPGKLDSGSPPMSGIASPSAQRSLSGMPSDKKRHWRGVLYYILSSPG